MHLEYAHQLLAKQQRVIDALERIGKIPNPDVQPCIPSPSPLAYRNKIQLPVRSGFKLGLYACNSHDLVEFDTCYIHCDLGQKVFEHVRQILQKSPLEGLKFVLLKTALATQQVVVVFVTENIDIPSHLVAEVMKRPEIKGFVQNLNPGEGNVILSADFRTLAGQGWIEEKLQGLSFKASAASFFQVNPAQAENLYATTLQFLNLSRDEAVLDAYCGIGTFSLMLAQKAKEVIGIEFVSQAVIDAEENAKRNHISNARFICGAAEELELPLTDAAVLNPPRKGCDPRFLEKIANSKMKKIAYISCDPATLARDLRLLLDKGYALDQIQPFDMFPQTAHVETVVKLSKF
jgi:23S rRNA (uracil1939-C5)-methyltransferase